ncbi:MAG TPA: hypothetical protein VK509_18050, partial [Polyangiales bacterium]|nr:hypothetical protein [Polyangiales bacterium]
MSFRGPSGLVFVVLAGVALGALAASQPEWNFDSIGYAGAAGRWLGSSDADLHQRVYAELEAAAPAKARREIAAGSGYRSALASDAHAFASQLPFYSGKPLYVALVALAARLGLNAVASAFYVSAVVYGLLAIAWLLALGRLASRPLAWGLGLCILLSPPLRELGRLGTPDALAALFAFAGACTVLFAHGRRGLGIALVLWLAAICARPDSAVFALALLAWLAWCSPQQRRAALAGALVCALACLAVSFTGGYPWSTLITHT